MKKLFAVLFLAGVSFNAGAIDSVSVEGGHGQGVDVARIGLQWDWHQHWLAAGGWHLDGYWDASAGVLHGRSGSSVNNDVGDFSFTPTIRYQKTDLSGLAPYVEFGAGAHLWTQTTITASKRSGTAFQFGEHVGVGLRFGAHGIYDLGFRFQHLSNAGIKDPNPGINLYLARFQVHFN
ncbi:MAG: acyloxyacyl hydrolase [Burkholderiales bacterium]